MRTWIPGQRAFLEVNKLARKGYSKDEIVGETNLDHAIVERYLRHGKRFQGSIPKESIIKLPKSCVHSHGEKQ